MKAASTALILGLALFAFGCAATTRYELVVVSSHGRYYALKVPVGPRTKWECKPSGAGFTCLPYVPCMCPPCKTMCEPDPTLAAVATSLGFPSVVAMQRHYGVTAIRTIHPECGQNPDGSGEKGETVPKPPIGTEPKPLNDGSGTK